MKMKAVILAAFVALGLGVGVANAQGLYAGHVPQQYGAATRTR